MRLGIVLIGAIVLVLGIWVAVITKNRIEKIERTTSILLVILSILLCIIGFGIILEGFNVWGNSGTVVWF